MPRTAKADLPPHEGAVGDGTSVRLACRGGQAREPLRRLVAQGLSLAGGFPARVPDGRTWSARSSPLPRGQKDQQGLLGGGGERTRSPLQNLPWMEPHR